MNKLKSILRRIYAFYSRLRGRKYYIVIARNRFNLHEFCVGHIFDNCTDAMNFRSSLQYDTTSDVGLEVHSFRSRREFDTYHYGE